MKKSLLVLLITAAWAGAIGLPGELLVASPQVLPTDAAQGLWYLGASPAGNLYLAEERALPALTPYRKLHDDPETSAYVLIYTRAPEAAARVSTYGDMTLLGKGVYLLVTSPAKAARLSSAGIKAEFARLRPAGFPGARAYRPAEEPPVYNADVAALLQSETEDEVNGYLGELVGYQTRFTPSQGYINASSYLHDFFADLGYAVTYEEFFGETFNGVAVNPDGERAWLASETAVIYHTTDGGRNWERQDSPVDNTLWSIYFLAGGTRGWAVGDGGTLVATADGGANWVSQSVPYNGFLMGVDFVDANRGVVVGDEGRIFSTADGGVHWNELSSPTGQRLYDVDMADAAHGWACGRNGVIVHTEDGTTWSLQTTPNTNRLYNVEAISATEAWACGWGNTLLHTVDGGETWTRIVFYNIPYTYFYGLSFPDAQHGYMVGTGGAFLYSTDGGEHWSYKAADTSTFMCCDFADADFGILGGSTILYRTLDGGGDFESLIDGFDSSWRSVVAEKPGWDRRDEVVIICGHLDSTSPDPFHHAPGAEDNGTGTVCAMAAARALAETPFERTIRFVGWGGEEQGLLGSWDYAAGARARDEKIIGVVNFDMVGYDEEEGERDDTTNFVNDTSEWLGEYFITVADLYGVQHTFDLVNDPEAGGSDHFPFWNEGYDAIMLIEGETGVGGTLEYPYYHTTEDTLDKITMKLLLDNARTGTGTVAHLARPTEVPAAAEPAPTFQPPVRNYPNPWRPGAAAITFAGIAAGSALDIYTLAGERIFHYEMTTDEGKYEWPVVTDGGAAIPAGVYLYKVKGPAQDDKGKLAIIR